MYKKISNKVVKSEYSNTDFIKTSFSSITRVLKEMISISKIYEFDNLETIHSALQDLNRNNVALQKKISNCLQKLPLPESYSYIDCAPSMTIEKDGLIYKYQLSNLIPHIIRVNTDNNELNYLYNTNAVYSGYRKAVEEYAIGPKFEIFSHKVLVCFINFFENEDAGIDVDNLDTKPFIDAAISRILVPDDNPKWVNISLLSAQGPSHTEVIVGYSKDVLQYISNHYSID